MGSYHAVLITEKSDYDAAVAALSTLAGTPYVGTPLQKVRVGHADAGKYILPVNSSGPFQYDDEAAAYGTVVPWDSDWKSTPTSTSFPPGYWAEPDE